VILDTPADGKIEFGHHAKTKEEFAEWVQAHLDGAEQINLLKDLINSRESAAPPSHNRTNQDILYKAENL
jgi:hypothetical protein